MNMILDSASPDDMHVVPCGGPGKNLPDILFDRR